MAICGSLSAGTFSGPRRLTSFGRLTLEAHSAFRARDGGFWCASTITAGSSFARSSLTDDLSTAETVAVLERQKRLPKAILSDHGSQFKDQWKSWCSERGIEAHFAHPSYPQDKGKVERCIQNLNREFVNHLRKFPEWLKGKLGDYRDWFNSSRFHRGVKAFPPVTLYECNVSNLT